MKTDNSSDKKYKFSAKQKKKILNGWKILLNFEAGHDNKGEILKIFVWRIYDQIKDWREKCQAKHKERLSYGSFFKWRTESDFNHYPPSLNKHRYHFSFYIKGEKRNSRLNKTVLFDIIDFSIEKATWAKETT